MKVVQKKNPHDFERYGLISEETGTAHGWYTILEIEEINFCVFK